MRAFFVLDNGNGTVRVEIDRSWNTPQDKPGQLVKLDMDRDPVPEVPDAKYLQWDGKALVPADAATVAAIEAAIPEPEPTIEDELAALKLRIAKVEGDVTTRKEAAVTPIEEIVR